MAHDAPTGPAGPSKLVIRNIGLLLSGAIENPILDADTVVAVDGRIHAVGRAGDVDTDGATTIIDARGSALAPGLIDSHVHPVAGDWTPRQNQIGWIDSSLHGGVTTMISAGEVHMPGRPKDIVGLKAMAIFHQRMYAAFRPGGVKVHGGAPIIEQGMVEQDFKDLADAGVRLLGEIGLGGVKQNAIQRNAPSAGNGLGHIRRAHRHHVLFHACHVHHIERHIRTALCLVGDVGFVPLYRHQLHKCGLALALAPGRQGV